ncbi:MAG: AI-2E family transporter [Turicibacter sp.]
MFEKLKIEGKHLSIGLTTILVGTILFFIYRLSLHSETILSGVFSFISTLFSVLAPVFYAFLISYILFRPVMFIQRKLNWMVKKLSKKELNNGVGRLLSIIIILGIAIWCSKFIINLIIPPLFQNVEMLLASLPKYQVAFTDWLQELTHLITDEQLIQLSSWTSETLRLIGTAILNLGTGVVTNLTGVILDFIVTVILTFYFLKEKESIFKSINKLGFVILPKKIHDQIKAFLHDLHVVFGNFIVGQLLDALLVGIASATLLLIIGHPFALVIGLVAGITNIIPYVGPIIGAALAFLLGLFTSMNMAILGFVLLIAYQQVDGYFIQPKILGDSVGLSPVWIFIAILVGGSYLGALGMIVAVPVAALVGLYINRRYTRITAKPTVTPTK